MTIIHGTIKGQTGTDSIRAIELEVRGLESNEVTPYLAFGKYKSMDLIALEDHPYDTIRISKYLNLFVNTEVCKRFIRGLYGDGTNHYVNVYDRTEQTNAVVQVTATGDNEIVIGNQIYKFEALIETMNTDKEVCLDAKKDLYCESDALYDAMSSYTFASIKEKLGLSCE